MIPVLSFISTTSSLVDLTRNLTNRYDDKKITKKYLSSKPMVYLPPRMGN